MKNIACVIVNYNDSKRTINLASTICSYASINEIIIVDNCSSDNSYSSLVDLKHEKIHLYKSPRNGGYGYGNNYGALKAKELGADYILIANPDVTFNNECVAHMAQSMGKKSIYAVVGAKEVKMGVFAYKYTSLLDDILSASLFFNKLLKKRYYARAFFENKKYAEVDIIPGCLLLVDLSKFFEIGGYDESVFLYEEEKILYCRLKNKYKSLVDLEVEYNHNHEESHQYTVRSALTGKKRLLASKYYFLKKYRRANVFTLFLAKIFFKLTIIEMLVWILVRNNMRPK